MNNQYDFKPLIIVFLVLFLMTMSACGGGGSGATAVVATQWPTANAVLVSTKGSNSCETLAGLGADCLYNNLVVTPGGISGILFTKILVSNTMACAIAEANGTAVDCGNLSDPTCLAPATNNNIYCWDFNDFSVINPTDASTQAGFDDVNFSTGPLSMQLNGAGDMCITYSVYNKNAGFVQDLTMCGTSLNGNGYLQ